MKSFKKIFYSLKTISPFLLLFVGGALPVAAQAAYSITLDPAVPVVNTTLHATVLNNGNPEDAAFVQFALNGGIPIFATTNASGTARFFPQITGTLTIYVSKGAVQLASISVPVLAAPDITPPVITVLGANPVDVIQNSFYADPGATAFDNIDGQVAVQTAGSADAAIAGTYIIVYTATDVSGNVATATRAVNVVASPPVICQTGADTNGDARIDILEILQHVFLWKLGDISILEILRAVYFWKVGDGC